MTEIGFYHLTRSTLTQALPRLLTRTLASGQRALVLGKTAEGLDALSAALWAQPDWLPHGSAADGDADIQPIWLSIEPKALNGARFLFVVEQADWPGLDQFDRVFSLFDGNSQPAVEAARESWRAAKAAGHTLTYWQQTETSWQKKA
nr:DNA polymerase III subunit chi [uncultured Rhodopila sp.]